MTKDKSVHPPLLIAGLIGSVGSYVIGEIVLYFCGTLPTSPLIGVYLAASLFICGMAAYLSEHLASGNYTFNWRSGSFHKDSLRAVLIFTAAAFVLGMGTQFLYSLLGNSLDSRDINFKGSMIVFDTSGSMESSDRDRKAIEAICDYIDVVPDGELMGLIVYNTDVYTTRDYIPLNGKAERDAIKEIVRALPYEGSTAMQSALMTALEQVREAQGEYPGIVLLFSDGLSSLDFNQIRKAARGDVDGDDRQIPVNTIYYSPGFALGGYQMSRIARDTGGQYMLADASQLVNMFTVSRQSYARENLNLLDMTYGPRRNSPVRIAVQALFIASWGVLSAFFLLMMLSTKKLITPFFVPKTILCILGGVLFAVLLLPADADGIGLRFIRIIPALMIGLVICPSYRDAAVPVNEARR